MGQGIVTASVYDDQLILCQLCCGDELIYQYAARNRPTITIDRRIGGGKNINTAGSKAVTSEKYERHIGINSTCLQLHERLKHTSAVEIEATGNLVSAARYNIETVITQKMGHATSVVGRII